MSLKSLTEHAKQRDVALLINQHPDWVRISGTAVSYMLQMRV